MTKGCHTLCFPGSRLCGGDQHVGALTGVSEDQPRMCRERMEARMRRGRGRAATSANLPGAPGRAGGWPCRVAPSRRRRRRSPAEWACSRGLRPGERCPQRCRAAGTVCPALQPRGNKSLAVGDVGAPPRCSLRAASPVYRRETATQQGAAV